MHFMPLVIAVRTLKFLLDNIYSVTLPQSLFPLSLVCSSQRKEPALLFCRPFVQSHEGIFSVL